MATLTTVATIILSYLLGAVPFGLLVARLHGVKDIRERGSGNIGATNVWRTAGPGAAAWVFILDIGKGAAALVLARLIGSSLLSADIFFICCGGAAIVGHVFPIYLRFKGGKGVNTALGVMVMLLPLETTIAVGLFLIVVGLTRYVSLGSIIGALGLPLAILLEQMLFERTVENIYLYVTLALALLVLLTHRKNLARLLSGTEDRFSLSPDPREVK
ncbi:MAG: glycerol-3-phosphate 1-O-acyltransferase PlsY [Candidatus Zixiibacteriota bacterium]|nr:MAG: glycerol-3-phosphate 1-O-acyltransferase PlsY [candidate division Zixibacteria bacterium]